MRGWYLAGAALAIALIAWWWRGDESRSEPVAAAVQASERAPSVAPRPALRAPARTVARAPARPFDASTGHSVDPCTAPVEPTIPPGYETVTLRGVTIAFPPDVAAGGAWDAPLRASSLAGYVAGMLDEAAQLTGTEPRSELTVIVDASRDDFHTRSRAPEWSGGIYDGGAVRLYAVLREDLGVSVATLRHEVMHAQLHAAVGCMPWWFNEGVAQYFAGTPPLAEWIAMLRAPGTTNLDAVQDPAIRELRVDDVKRSYAWSLAMTLYVIERGGDAGLRSVANTLAAAGSHAAAVELWDKTFPHTGPLQVLDALAQHIFGKPRDALGGMLDGAMCCHGLRDARSVACRATEPRTARHWFEGTAPRALCENRW